MRRLRKIAEAATPGRWVAHANHQRSGGIPVIEHTVVPDHRPSWIVADVRDGEDADAEFIATFDPPTVLALLDVVDALDNVLFGIEDPAGNLTAANLGELREQIIPVFERLREVSP